VATETTQINLTGRPVSDGRRRAGQDSREKILAAADRLFGDLGFDAASTREISELSGHNKALIHYHFKSKDDLLGAVLERHYERLGEALMTALAPAKTTQERIFAGLDAYMDFLAKNHNFARIVQREIASGRHVDLVWKRTLPFFEMVSQWANQAFPKSRDGDLAAPQLMVSFYGMVITYFAFSGVLEKFTGLDPLAPEQIEQRKAHLRRMTTIVCSALLE
jgi:AcrR family transcriptional regulator